MLSLLLSLILSPAASEARSIMPWQHHYAEIMEIKTDGAFPVMKGTVTFLQGCADHHPQVQLSMPSEPHGEKIVKLRVQLSSMPGDALCLALPTEQQLDFTVDTESGPVIVVADTNFYTNVVQTAQIEAFYFQPDTALANESFVSGNVLIDQESKAISLTLYRKVTPCPEGQLCAAMIQDPFIESVPLQSVTKGFCGETIYSGLVDMLPVDGNLKEIKVIDNTTNTCKTFIALPATEVLLRYVGGWASGEQYHNFHASALQLVNTLD